MAIVTSARPEIEEMLFDRGAHWTFFEEFDLALIDVGKSLANQARISSPLNAEQVSTYEDAMKRGDKFPAIVVYKQGQKYVVIDGNHRVAAALNTGYKLGAYVLDPKKVPAQVIVMLTYEANTKHGLPTSQSERARHAVYLIENANETIVNAAARMNIPTNYLQRYYSTYRADQRAARLGVPSPRWRELHIGSRHRLNSLGDDDVFVRAVEYAFKARLNATEVEDLVIRLRQLNSAADQIAAIETEEGNQTERLAAVASGEIRPRRNRIGGPRVALRQGSAMLEALVGEKRQALLDAMTPIEAEEWLPRLRHTLVIGEELVHDLEQKAKE